MRIDPLADHPSAVPLVAAWHMETFGELRAA